MAVRSLPGAGHLRQWAIRRVSRDCGSADCAARAVRGPSAPNRDLYRTGRVCICDGAVGAQCRRATDASRIRGNRHRSIRASRINKLKTAAAGASVLAGGLGLSAFFWLPALLERDFVKTELLRTGLLSWTNYIIYPSQLFWSPWGYGISMRGPSNGISYSLGLIHIALAVAGLLVAMRMANRTRQCDALVFAGASIVGALLATDLSWAIWEHVGTLQYLVYPWRTLCVPALFMPLLALYAFDAMGPRFASAAIVVLVLVNLAHTQPKGIQTYDEEYYSADLIAQKGINTTTREEYEPRTVYHRPAFDSVLLKGVRSAPVVSQLAVSSNLQRFTVDASEPALMQDSLFDYPGWTVLVDDRQVATSPASDSGEITFTVPAGTA